MITLLQAAQIEVLREQGIGYRNIATELGITRDAVRNYCRSHELAGDRTKKKAAEKKQDPEKCAWCGESFEQNERGRKKRFCSSECRLAWWNENRASLKKRASSMRVCKCKGCGKDFIVYSTAERQYCSQDCYFEHRFNRILPPDVSKMTPVVKQIS